MIHFGGSAVEAGESEPASGDESHSNVNSPGVIVVSVSVPGITFSITLLESLSNAAVPNPNPPMPEASDAPISTLCNSGIFGFFCNMPTNAALAKPATDGVRIEFITAFFQSIASSLFSGEI